MERGKPDVRSVLRLLCSLDHIQSQLMKHGRCVKLWFSPRVTLMMLWLEQSPSNTGDSESCVFVCCSFIFCIFQAHNSITVFVVLYYGALD